MKKKPKNSKSKEAIASNNMLADSNKSVTKFKIEYDAECEECDWKGNKDEMEDAEDDDHVQVCPLCGSERIYYFR